MPNFDKSEFVEITHFINPHVFWLRKCNIVDHDFDGVESKLQQYAFKQYDKLLLSQCQRKLERCDRVAVYFVSWKKWLRCDVDVIDAKCTRCILWAIDYGFPFQSSIDLIVSIEDRNLAYKCTNRIMKAAISTVLPWKESSKNVVSHRQFLIYNLHADTQTLLNA